MEKSISNLPPTVAKKISEANSGGTAKPTTPPAIPPAPAGGQAGDDGNSNQSQKVKPALFGGWRGGKKTKSGFPPGSPEHAAWKREQDAKRKRNERAENRAANPPVLPPKPVATNPQPAATTVSPGSSVPIGATAPIPAQQIAPPSGQGILQWQPRDLLPVAKNAVPLMETLSTRPILTKARRANLPPELLAEIERDSKMTDGQRQMLIETSSELTAKYLNKSGVSAEWKCEVNFGVAISTWLLAQQQLHARLDKLIAAANPPVEKKSS